PPSVEGGGSAKPRRKESRPDEPYDEMLLPAQYDSPPLRGEFFLFFVKSLQQFGTLIRLIDR
ncbi:MAG: hypothetical protein IJK12_06555, partial [Clostridia bacterium]|nr:hypothetical protein [Clostridia bacterium]